ncbi:CA [Mytilus edulis]|uniref:CA n=1 Tax=Mytilus edulis TaxID=6550 RepID=A0A8S3R5S9_MYTED|nr:CA [Mytilus edulis]
MCAGTMQSPVNIETHRVVKNNKIGKFYFSGLRKTAGMKMELKNYGHGGWNLQSNYERIVSKLKMLQILISEFGSWWKKSEIFTEGNNKIVDTFRPVQPLLQRKVSLSCPSKYYYGHSHPKANEYGCINHGYGKQKVIRRTIIIYLEAIAVYGLNGIETNEILRNELIKKAT